MYSNVYFSYNYLCFFLMSVKIKTSSASIFFRYLRIKPASLSVKPSSAIWLKTNPSVLTKFKQQALAIAKASLFPVAKTYKLSYQWHNIRNDLIESLEPIEYKYYLNSNGFIAGNNPS